MKNALNNLNRSPRMTAIKIIRDHLIIFLLSRPAKVPVVLGSEICLVVALGFISYQEGVSRPKKGESP